MAAAHVNSNMVAFQRRPLADQIYQVKVQLDKLEFFMEDYRGNQVPINAKFDTKLDVLTFQSRQESCRIKKLEEKFEALENLVSKLMTQLNVPSEKTDQDDYNKDDMEDDCQRAVEDLANDMSTAYGRKRAQLREARTCTDHAKSTNDSSTSGVGTTFSSQEHSLQENQDDDTEVYDTTPVTFEERGTQYEDVEGLTQIIHYPDPTEAMLNELRTSGLATTNLQGQFNTNLANQANLWRKIIQDTGVGRLKMPPILLPANLGGGKVAIEFEHPYVRSCQYLHVNLHLEDNPYNTNVVHLPLFLGVSLKITNSVDGTLLYKCSGVKECRHLGISDHWLCRVPLDDVRGTEPPSVFVTFFPVPFY